MYMGFDWDDANIEKVARHQVRPDEAEQAVDDPHALSVQAYAAGGEVRFGLMGATVEGRVLVVIYTWRGDQRRVVTAFPVNPRQERVYIERSSG
jgi:uncharacterized protein